MGFDTYIFDLDGTLYRGKTLIKGADKVITALREKGKRIFFLTNSATQSRKSLCEKLKKFGINAHINEIYPSCYLLANYLLRNYNGKTVYCVSEEGMADELRAAGIKISNEDADIVAVGLDRKATYEKLSKAFRLIINGSIFLASNDDPTFPVEDGFLPGAGAFVAFLSRSTGKNPIIIGKPHKEAVEIILTEHNLAKKGAVLIGDRLDTDILTAKNAGIASALVLSGVSKKEDIQKIKPNYVLKSLDELLSI